MLSKIFCNLLSVKTTNSANHHSLSRRRLSLESLENRELLSVAPILSAIDQGIYTEEPSPLSETPLPANEATPSSTRQTFTANPRITTSTEMFFNIKIDAASIAPNQSATLTLRLNDRDFNNNYFGREYETDSVFINGVELMNQTSWEYEPGSSLWSQRVFSFDASLLKIGDNMIRIVAYCPANWETHCDSATITLNAEELPTFQIECTNKSTTYDVPVSGDKVELKATFDKDISDKYEIVEVNWKVINNSTSETREGDAQNKGKVEWDSSSLFGLRNNKDLTVEFTPGAGNHGVKKVTCQIILKDKSTGKPVTLDMEETELLIFFKHDAKDGLFNFSTPNWFKYWNEDGAVPLLRDSGVDYMESSENFGGYYPNGSGTGRIKISNLAASDKHFATAAYINGVWEKYEKGLGIDGLTGTLWHEMTHRRIDAHSGEQIDYYVDINVRLHLQAEQYWERIVQVRRILELQSLETLNDEQQSELEELLHLTSEENYVLFSDSERIFFEREKERDGMAELKERFGNKILLQGETYINKNGKLSTFWGDSYANDFETDTWGILSDTWDMSGTLHRLDAKTGKWVPFDTDYWAYADNELQARRSQNSIPEAYLADPKKDWSSEGKQVPPKSAATSATMELDTLAEESALPIRVVSSVQGQQNSTQFVDGSFSERPISEGSQLYKSLLFETQVSAEQAGSYNISFSLYDSKDNRITSVSKSVDLVAGVNTIEIEVPGSLINQIAVDGSYTASFSLCDSEYNVLDVQLDAFSTRSYRADQFVPAVAIVSIAETTVDKNANALYDNLRLSASVYGDDNGEVAYNAWLSDSNGNVITSVYGTTTIGPATSVIDFDFNGLDLFASRYDGAYSLGLSIFNPHSNEVIFSDTDLYQTAAYSYTQFEGAQAAFADTFTDRGTDRDVDGKFDVLTIDTKVDVARAGEYEIIAYLNDADGNFAGYATVTANLAQGEQTVSLDFDVLYLNNGTQWTLSWIALYDSQTGMMLDTLNDAYTTKTYSPGSFSNQGVVFTSVNSDAGRDTNSNRKYDYLDINLGVSVSVAGNYTLSALMLDNEGNSVGWYKQDYTLGLSDSSIQLQIEGRDIGNEMHNGPYRLAGVTLHDENGNLVAVGGSYTTADYTFNQFEGIPIYINGAITEQIVDANQDDYADFLEVTIPVFAEISNNYNIEATLADESGNTITTFMASSVYLSGNQTNQVRLQFYAADIYAHGVSGKLMLKNLTVNLPSGQRGDTLYVENAFQTQDYDVADFRSEPEVGDSVATAAEIVFSDNRFEIIERIGNGAYAGQDVDMYKLSVSSADLGRTYTFETSLPQGAGYSSIDTYLRLFNSSGTELQYNDDGGEDSYSKMTFTPTAAGTYYLIVSSYGNRRSTFNVPGSGGGGYSGDYLLTVSATAKESDLRLIASAQTTLSLDWNNVDGATEYVLQRKGPGETEFATVYTGAESKYVDRGLTAGTRYEYRVHVAGAELSNAVTFSTAASHSGSTPLVDSPMILSTEYDTANNRNTIVWTNLGDDYVYTVYKSGRVVVDGGSDAFYIDPNPTATGTDGYTILAYHTKMKQYSTIVTAVLHSKAPAVEITGVNFLDNGKVKLLWDVQPGMYFTIMQSGRTISGDKYIESGEWIDENPDDSKEYLLVTFYPDSGGESQVTFSNLFSAKRPAQSAMVAYESFWSEYGLTNDLL